MLLSAHQYANNAFSRSDHCEILPLVESVGVRQKRERYALSGCTSIGADADVFVENPIAKSALQVGTLNVKFTC